jgi:hypothetical protein
MSIQFHHHIFEKSASYKQNMFTRLSILRQNTLRPAGTSLKGGVRTLLTKK